MKVLVACEYSGRVRRAFAEKGHEVYSCDLLPADDEATYKEFLSKLPETIGWTKLKDFEKEDNTKSSQTFACSGDSCEIVDLT